jgi:hypothetical protein
MDSYIQSSRGDIRTDQRALLGVAELKEGVGSFLLLLLAVQIQDRKVDVVEKLRVVLDAVAAREEHDNLLLQVALQEGEQE